MLSFIKIVKKSADTGIVISKAPHRRYFIFIHKVIHTKMRSVWIWWWCLYWSSLCLKTPVSSLLNLALKAMKLETLCAKTKPDKSFTTSRCALVRIRLRVGLKFCTHKNRLSKKPLIGLKRLSLTRGCPFVCIKFWVPTKVTAERPDLSSDHQSENSMAVP